MNSSNSFSNSFLEILKDNHPLEKIYNNFDKEFVEIVNKNMYKLDKTVDNIFRLAPVILQNIKKEQKILNSTKDYYIGCDIETNTYYICFKNILMIDIDDIDKNYNIDYTTVINHFENLDESYCIYKSNHGYHVFCVSRYFNYYEKDTLKLMLDNHCDYYYIIYSYLRGFCVRLNKKNTCEHDNLYKLLHITKKENVDKKILHKINLDTLVQKYKDLSIFKK